MADWKSSKEIRRHTNGQVIQLFLKEEKKSEQKRCVSFLDIDYYYENRHTREDVGTATRDSLLDSRWSKQLDSIESLARNAAKGVERLEAAAAEGSGGGCLVNWWWCWIFVLLIKFVI
jgi:hypothetical protein